MAWGYPSATDVFIPTASTNVQASANLVVNFSRNIKDFALNNYVKLIPAKKKLGYWKRLATGQQARMESFTDGRQFLWNPGQDSPRGNFNTQGFQSFPYNMRRYAFTHLEDQLTIDQADYELTAALTAQLAQQAMTLRTQLTLTQLTTTGNWAGTHTGTATAIGGGLWSGASATNPYIMTSLQKMAIQINQDTLGTVRTEHLSVIMNPNTAAATARSQEMRSYLSNQVQSILFLKGEAPTPASLYNLPDRIYGFRLYVEDAVVNTGKNSPVDDLTNNSYVLPDGAVIMLARPGELPGMEGATDFSTMSIFMLEEMSVETFPNPVERNVLFRVTEDYDPELTAPTSGFYLSGAI